MGRRCEKLAKSTGRSRSFLAAEAISAYLDTNEWQVAGITTTGILRMNSEPPRIFAFSPRLGKPGWRRGRLSSPLTLRTAAEGADLAIFANIWTHSSLRSPLNA